VQNCIANAMIAYARLHQLGKVHLAFPSVLARYAVAQTRDFRVVGGHLAIKDVLSPYCQAKKNVSVERLDKFDEQEQTWCEAIVEDRTAGPAETARVRIDFAAWLSTLKRRDRRVSEALALGNHTSDVAKRYKISAGRISQLRRELAESWRRFVGDEPAPAAA
jgi:hypothetical protein